MKTIAKSSLKELSEFELLQLEGGNWKSWIEKGTDAFYAVINGTWAFDYLEGSYIKGYDSYDCGCDN